MNIDQIVSNLEKLKEQYKQSRKEAFTQGLSCFFKEQDQIKMIHFCTWIPGWNDGEPCEFTVGGSLFTSSLNKDIVAESYDYNLDKEVLDIVDAEESQSMNEHLLTPNTRKKIKEVAKLLELLDLEEVVGANSDVYITEEGVQIEEYDCGY